MVKKEGRRAKFERHKILAGMLRACEKRPVAYERIEETVSAIEHHFRQRGDSEVPALEIGEQVMHHLRTLDEVAYVRFASVYRDFKDVTQFAEELKVLDKLRRTLTEG